MLLSPLVKRRCSNRKEITCTTADHIIRIKALERCLNMQKPVSGMFRGVTLSCACNTLLTCLYMLRMLS